MPGLQFAYYPIASHFLYSLAILRQLIARGVFPQEDRVKTSAENVSVPDRLISDPGRLKWRVHPARQRLGASCLALCVIAVVAWLAADLMESWRWAVLAAAFLLFTLRRFFLPSLYELDNDGITVRSGWSSRRFRWKEVRRFLYDERGAFLSQRARSSTLDSIRGMHLLFGDHREAVIARIEMCLSKEDRQPCSG